MKQLQGLLAFVETAKLGSLTAAAERLELTPAAVSKSLARLEADLGVRLFNRSTRRLALTGEGERFLHNASGALRALDEAVADVSQSAVMPSGRVRISVGTAFGRRWVLPLLPAIIDSHPRLSIELDLDNRLVDLVAEGYDIGIRGGVSEDSSLVARRVCGLPLVLVASPAYLQRHGVPRQVGDLASHRCLAVRFSSGARFVWRFKASGRNGPALTDFTPDSALVVSDPETSLDLALQHAGIAQTGLQYALPYLRSGRLQLVLADQHDPGARDVVLHYPHRQYLAPRVRVVVDELLRQLGQAADLHLQPRDVPQFSAPQAGPGAPDQPAAKRRRKTSRSGSDAGSSKA